MKTTLPKKSKEHEATIHQIRDIILKKGDNRIAFIILFGSFARGDFVHDYYVEDGIRYSYVSDFDILIAIRRNNKSVNYNSTNLKNSIIKEIRRNHLDRYHPTSLVIEPLKHINKMLSEGHYFFSDIKKEGILLYKNEECELTEPKELTNEEKRRIAQRHFDNWFESGNDFLFNVHNSVKAKKYKNAAFQLHQTTENFLNCSLLVLTDYKPKTHKLEDLNRLCSSQSNKFLNIFPKATIEQEECFELLDNAYIGARYNPDYKITKEQLEYLISKVQKLKEVTAKVCKEKINSFK